MAQLVMPRVQAMVLCDDAVESGRESGVFYLIGVRTVIDAPLFPVEHSLCVFVQMSGHQGEASFLVKIEHEESGDVIGDIELQNVVFDNPTVSVPSVFRFGNCVFPAPGLYYIEVYHDGKLIGERRLNLRIKE